MPSAKLMFKPHYLVNEATGQKLTVHPPRLPGANSEKGEKWKNEKGEWIRNFSILDHNGTTAFAGQTHILMTHAPGAWPSIVVNGERWTVRRIEKEPVSARKVAAPAEVKV
jgi:hypothetical protein